MTTSPSTPSADRRQLSLSVDDCPVIAVCAGKDCRKRCEFAKVRKAIDRHCDVIELKCIGLCNGPVVVARPDTDAPVIYSKLRSKRDRRLVVGVATGDSEAVRQLDARQVDKKKAIASLRRQLERRVAS